jgi:hypothetical protein
MSTVKKPKDGGRASKAILVEKMPSHANDPFVLKKIEQAKKTVSQINFNSEVFKK